MSDLITRWSVNESLLQSYRSIFISSQSFLLAAGAILVDETKPTWLLYILAGAALLIIWWLWFRIVLVRGRAVDYYKFQMDEKFNNLFKDCSEGEFINQKQKRDEILKITNPNNKRTTRRKMDLVLPIIFTLIWATLLAARCPWLLALSK